MVITFLTVVGAGGSLHRSPYHKSILCWRGFLFFELYGPQHIIDVVAAHARLTRSNRPRACWGAKPVSKEDAPRSR